MFKRVIGLFSPRKARSSMPARNNRGSKTLRFEGLENRTLLSVTPVALLRNGTLAITGSTGNDQLEIHRVNTPQADQIVVLFNGGQAPFPTNKVTKLDIKTGIGNDVININDLISPYLKSITIDTGSGNDTVMVGATSAPVTVKLGDGDDCLVAISHGISRWVVNTGYGNDRVNARMRDGTTIVQAWMPGNKEVFAGSGYNDIAVQEKRGKRSTDVVWANPGDRLCLDPEDVLNYYPANPMPPSGIQFDTSNWNLTIDFRSFLQGLKWQVSGPHSVDVFWNEPWGRMSHRFDNVQMIIVIFSNAPETTVDLTGFAGDVKAYGGQGSDTLIANEANNVRFTGGAGDDTLYAQYTWSVWFNGEDGDDVLHAENAHSAWFSGGNGDDVCYAGNGEFLGGAGNDTLYGHGYGHEDVENWPGYDPAHGDRWDRLTLPNGVTYDATGHIMMIDLRATPADFDLSVADGNHLRLRWDSRDRALEVSSVIVTFANNGGMVNLGGFTGNVTAHGGPGNDILHAENAASALFHGEAGNDTLYASNGQFHGGAGNDTLFGHGRFSAADGVARNDFWSTFDPSRGDHWDDRDPGGTPIVPADNQYDVLGTTWFSRGDTIEIYDVVSPVPGREGFGLRINEIDLEFHFINFAVYRLEVPNAANLHIAAAVQQKFTTLGTTLNVVIIPGGGTDDLLYG